MDVVARFGGVRLGLGLEVVMPAQRAGQPRERGAHGAGAQAARLDRAAAAVAPEEGGRPEREGAPG